MTDKSKKYGFPLASKVILLLLSFFLIVFGLISPIYFIEKDTYNDILFGSIPAFILGIIMLRGALKFGITITDDYIEKTSILKTKILFKDVIGFEFIDNTAVVKSEKKEIIIPADIQNHEELIQQIHKKFGPKFIE